MHPLETYLHDLGEIHASGAGVKETSYYPVLAAFLNELGKALKPKVRCIIHLRSAGAGIPDGGLFSADQLRGLDADADPLQGQLPARAVLEVKGVGADLHKTADSAQVAKYLKQYGLVLVTNYREFLLVKARPTGQPEKLESYQLAASDRDFWRLAAQPRAAAQAHGDLLADYLRRVMLHAAPLTSPRDVAWFLASYAREARALVEAGDVEALTAIRATLEDTLGLTFDGDKGEHFFRSTLVQTLFYGVFSAWVLWHGEDPARADAFDWRTAAYYLRVPVITALFEELADASKLRALRLLDVLNWAGAALNRVQRPAFFASFETGHAVQYFYEPFLEAFDPQLRKDLGVWYTPPEIVQYMVARVDRALRDELALPNGLADPQVLVLDPCAGTGAYLVEVLRSIAATLHDQGEGALVAGEVNRAARERVFGFEILPASYVIAHLQLGLLLQNLGAPLADGQRAAMYLTNSLTGWEPPAEPKTQLPLWQELAAERDAAEHVKRHARILVVLGNPPYNAFAGTSPAEEQGLVEPYKAGLNTEWGIKKFNLDDLYVRFFRMAERRIAEQTGQGIVCYISNYSYLGDPSFVVMRQRFLREFDALWFDSLNGDSRETGKLTPDGQPDPSVFSTPFNREGIRVGTAIGLMVRRAERAPAPAVVFREFWGAAKRQELLASLQANSMAPASEVVTPAKSNRYSFRPSAATSEYLAWPRLTDLAAEAPSNGLMEKRGGALMDMDKSALEQRMRLYYDPNVDWATLKAQQHGLTEDMARYDAKQARAKITAIEAYQSDRLRRYALRPFDTRWCYYSPTRPLWNEPRPTLWAQIWPGNSYLMSRPSGVASPEGTPVYFTRMLGDNDFLRGHAYYFPLRLRKAAVPTAASQLTMFAAGETTLANLSALARAYVSSIGIAHPDADADTATLLWMHVLSVSHSPAYLSDNADGIRADWPRVPLPNTADLLHASAALGRQVAALLDTETPVPGVTTGAIRPELKLVGVVEGPAPLNLEVTAGWGSAGREGVVMPGRGRLVQRAAAPAEHIPALGDQTADVYLNDDTYWRNIPLRVWDYTIGGYQVIKKWLSYREAKLLGRALTPDEAREVRDMARRLAALVLLEPALDANYAAVKAAAYPWPQPAA